MGRVSGKVAIITGGASGLGKADAELLAAEGAKVVITDINDAQGKALAEDIGESALYVHLDVTQEDDWKAAIQKTLDHFGRLDVLVNNAGIVILADPEETTLEQFRLANSIMTEGVFLGCKYAIPAMAASGGGSIINMSSVASHLGFSIFFAYSAAKGAVRSMTKSVALHCQEKGYDIRCNSVHPGSIETPMVQFATGRADEEPAVIPDGKLPIDSAGAAKDVAYMVVYLASDESRFMNGAEIMLDNGLIIQ
ncbi:MAG: SDR family oxidoreductase [Emcibacter sp.]|nr:SDR family oxidoreductase [Emcibacter sp.]